MLTMQAGDIWRKDTTAIHPTNVVQHWLILDIKNEYIGRVIIKYMVMETGYVTDTLMTLVDLKGSPYYKKVA